MDTSALPAAGVWVLTIPELPVQLSVATNWGSRSGTVSVQDTVMLAGQVVMVGAVASCMMTVE